MRTILSFSLGLTIYDMYNMYSPLGTVIYLGDFNAKLDISSRHSRDNILYNFLSDGGHECGLCKGLWMGLYYIVNVLINVTLRHTCFKGVFCSFLRASYCAGVP